MSESSIFAEATKDLYETEEQRVIIVNNLKSLSKSGNWSTVVKILDYNIGIAMEQLISGVAGDKEDDSIRERIRAYRALKTLPETYIAKLEPATEHVDSRDPYEDSDEVEDKSDDPSSLDE